MSQPSASRPERRVLLVAPDQRVGRVADEPLGERAQLVLVEPLGDEQVLAHGHLVAGAFERVEGVDGGRAVRVVQEGEGHGRGSYEASSCRPT